MVTGLDGVEGYVPGTVTVHLTVGPAVSSVEERGGVRRTVNMETETETVTSEGDYKSYFKVPIL